MSMKWQLRDSFFLICQPSYNGLECVFKYNISYFRNYISLRLALPSALVNRSGIVGFTPTTDTFGRKEGSREGD